MNNNMDISSILNNITNTLAEVMKEIENLKANIGYHNINKEIGNSFNALTSAGTENSEKLKECKKTLDNIITKKNSD